MTSFLRTLLLAPVLLVAAPALAADPDGWSSYGTDELSSSMERVPPAVIFVLDLSSDMNNPCDGSTGDPCIDVARDAILQVIRHFDWATFGVVGTVSSSSSLSFTPIAPGDLIATGTPSGVGFARKPPIFMKAGDLVEVEIEGIGVLRNRLEAEPV